MYNETPRELLALGLFLTPLGLLLFGNGVGYLLRYIGWWTPHL
jgi:hypothetical protein